MFIQTESTPNPNAVKFFPGIEVSSTPMHFATQEEAKNIKLVMKLLQQASVLAVFYGSDFITITKREEDSWESVKPFIIASIMDHLTLGFHPMEGLASEVQELDTTGLSEIEKQIVEILDTRVRPSVAMDGGDITYIAFENGIVYLELKGSCSGCPSSTMTLKNGIESMLQYYIPEVIAVEASRGE